MYSYNTCTYSYIYMYMYSYTRRLFDCPRKSVEDRVSFQGLEDPVLADGEPSERREHTRRRAAGPLIREDRCHCAKRLSQWLVRTKAHSLSISGS